jgi:hypothetical protein
MSDAGARTDDDTATTASNAERVPTGSDAIDESARRAEDLENFESAEHRRASEPSGTTSTDDAD